MDHIITSFRLVLKIFKITLIMILLQIKISSLIYMMIICKVNNDDEDIIPNIDKHNNHLLFVYNPNLYKLIH